jgi:SHAQKYF class myb-like DNA-binding protein
MFFGGSHTPSIVVDISKAICYGLHPFRDKSLLQNPFLLASFFWSHFTCYTMNNSFPVNVVVSKTAPSSDTADDSYGPEPCGMAIPKSDDGHGLRVSAPNTDSAAGDGSGAVITPRGSSSSVADKEKIGRWTEQEHQVFLEGLEKHGKQWKLIANMIGTRTVVQVRTHAQKYFQRMERHVVNKGNLAPSSPSKPSAKRKMSLPPSLPSRSIKKPKLPKKVARSSSLSALPSQLPTEV